MTLSHWIASGPPLANKSKMAKPLAMTDKDCFPKMTDTAE
jgi:hypothetical protein